MTVELTVEQDVKQNLCNYYILPLVKRSLLDFQAGGFINSYLDIENFLVVVEVTNVMPYFKNYSHYEFAVEKFDTTYLFYTIPEHFHYDVALFVSGSYSEFSKKAKQSITRYSKLPYKLTPDGFKDTSVWIHVMYKTENLRKTLEQELNVTIDSTAELASKPNENNFFYSI